MVHPLFNDGSLIGFWPLDEPSGVPLFRNHSPARSHAPSGLSFDFKVAVAETTTSDVMRSVWPGTDAISTPSGVIRGYRVQGSWKQNASSSPFSRYLIAGQGDRAVREQFAGPPTAQSGFTVGVWIYPATNGNSGFWSISNVPTDSWNMESAACHQLISKYDTNTANAGWRIGVSGLLLGGAQNDTSQFGGPFQLRAFLANTALTAPTVLDVPIESGRYTHITFSFRYIDGTNNQVVLYKDGRVAVSGTTTDDFTLDNAAYFARPLAIGASDNSAAAADTHARTTGWGNMVSGVYFFRRVLHEGEILDLHTQGGLQPAPDLLTTCKEVLITDSKLLGYYPFISLGYADASANHESLISNFDEGDTTVMAPTPGPFNGGGVFNPGAGGSVHYSASSGLCQDVINAGSWTVSCWHAPNNGLTHIQNMIMSWGSISNEAASDGPNAITTSTFGFYLTKFNAGVTDQESIRLSVFPVGDITAGAQHFVPSGRNFFDSVASHYAVVYDNQTRGIAYYIDGYLQGSGNLSASLTDQLSRLAGSGYPLMFGNGIIDQPADASTKGLNANGNNDVWIGGPFTVMGRPLEPSEVRFLAESGVNISNLRLSRYDTRMCGYWPCDDFKIDDIVVEDKARVWDRMPGHMLRGDMSARYAKVVETTATTNVNGVYGPNGTSRVDLFANRTTPPELASFGNLGITSGVFGMFGYSTGAHNLAGALGIRSSRVNHAVRLKPCIEDRSTTPQTDRGEYIISFEVTPSGNIPASDFGLLANTNKLQHNSLCHIYGNQGGGTGDGEFYSFLTTQLAAQGSGVTIVFMGRDGTFAGTTMIPLASGNVSFGVPNRVLFHTKFQLPYNNITAGATPYQMDLWINGVYIMSNTRSSTNTRMWNDAAPDAATDDWCLQIGGEAATDAITAAPPTYDGGLGQIYMREIFVMRGKFEKGEIEHLAASGLREPIIAGYIEELPKTAVNIGDNDLVGYWRFNGFDGGPAHGVQGSGTRDLSLNGNHLLPLAEIRAQRGDATQGAFFQRVAPGPFRNSDLGVPCSGFHYQGRVVTANVTNLVAPFMVSGEAFNNPNNGFSVGMMINLQADEAVSTRNNILMCYGLTAANSITDTTRDGNRSWCITMGDSEEVKMIVSQGGNMYLDGGTNAAQSGQTVVGVFPTNSTSEFDQRQFNVAEEQGVFGVPGVNYWAHYAWVYDPAPGVGPGTLSCYLNGVLVDRKQLKNFNAGTFPFGSGIMTPALAEARYITFRQHSHTTPWTFNTGTINDYTRIFTDVFYFKRALSEAEVRYIAFNGIDDVTGTVCSGIIGGYIAGQDTASGIIGGYLPGQDTASGIIGGIINGSVVVSGMIGGYVSGVVFATGQVGAYIHGLDTVSGIIGGYVLSSEQASGIIGAYIQGTNTGSGHIAGYIIGSTAVSGMIGGLLLAAAQCSGIIGGWILGGLSGNLQFDAAYTVSVIAAQDFDAMLEARQQNSADFDARAVIFQAELPPEVGIIIPGQTVTGQVPPFNQYFIGAASGLQGKTITKTRWTFGDLTPSVEIPVSGAGFHPVQHRYVTSGIYIAKFEAYDSHGIHNSATRIINIASGIPLVEISISGQPRSGNAALIVDFNTRIENLPPGVSISTQLLLFDDGQTSIAFSPTHAYTEPGIYKPIWTVRDSRGFHWSDSLEAGADN